MYKILVSLKPKKHLLLFDLLMTAIFSCIRWNIKTVWIFTWCSEMLNIFFISLLVICTSSEKQPFISLTHLLTAPFILGSLIFFALLYILEFFYLNLIQRDKWSFHTSEGNNSTRRCSTHKYICSKYWSTCLHKTNITDHKRSNKFYRNHCGWYQHPTFPEIDQLNKYQLHHMDLISIYSVLPSYLRVFIVCYSTLNFLHKICLSKYKSIEVITTLKFNDLLLNTKYIIEEIRQKLNTLEANDNA